MGKIDTASKESKKQILKSSSIVGGATFVNILIGLLKVKALAVLLGPSGIGVMSILVSVMGAATTLTGMGINKSGVRELARTEGGELALAKKSLWVANLILGSGGGGVVWFFRDDIAIWVFNDVSKTPDVGLIGLGVFLSLIAASQTALLQGLRKITDLAKVRILSALFATVLGLFSVYFKRDAGIVIFVVAVPFSTVLVAWFYCRKIQESKQILISFEELLPYWKSLFALGFVFMVTELMVQVTQLLVRYYISDQLDLISVGYFQASWTISMTYIGFVLAAMGADFYPRLSAISDKKHEAIKLINHQIEIALVLAAPVLVVMMAFSPMVIKMLYSAEFSPSVPLLRWQILGDVFKILTWPLGFALLAAGKGREYFVVQLSWNFIYSLGVYFGLKHFGLSVTGAFFAISYIFILLVLMFLLPSVLSFENSATVLTLSIVLTFSLVSIFFIAELSEIYSMVVGAVLTLFFAAYSYRALSEITDLNVRANRLKNKLGL